MGGEGTKAILLLSALATAVVRSVAIALLHCNENPTFVFLFWELRGLSPNFHIHVSVSDDIFPGSVHIRGEIQMIPESAYKSSASKN